MENVIKFYEELIRVNMVIAKPSMRYKDKFIDNIFTIAQKELYNAKDKYSVATNCLNEFEKRTIEQVYPSLGWKYSGETEKINYQFNFKISWKSIDTFKSMLLKRGMDETIIDNYITCMNECMDEFR